MPRRYPFALAIPDLVPIACVVAAAGLAGCGSGSSPERDDPLGRAAFEVSCTEAAQREFSDAVSLLHHMTYPQARQAFEHVAVTDPDCAMAHWGVAMTLFQPLWPTRPSTEDLRLGWAEVEAAEQIGAPTPRERLYIATAQAFFDPAHADYWARIGAWEAAARELYEAFPEDHDAATFYALAHLATAPATGETVHQATAAGILARVLEEEPTHPGAIHYTIHANDAPDRERESLDVVRRYLEIAPRNPHALHMPTHIFVRLGEWDEVIEWNGRAAEAALEHPAGDREQWVWDEFPHAMEYLVYAHLQRGDDAAARQALDQLRGTARLQPSFKTAFHLASIPARYALERKAWTDAAVQEARPDPSLPWDRFPWPEAIGWFARGMGSVRSGSVEPARSAEARLNELRAAAEASGEGLFARNIEMLRLQLSAWLAHADGRADEAVERMRAAAALEAETPKHPVTPAPTLPAEESLGDLLLELSRAADALEAYRASLRAAPGRFNSLAGAARAAREAGDSAAAASYYQALRDQSAADSPRAAVAEAAAFLNARSRP